MALSTLTVTPDTSACHIIEALSLPEPQSLVVLNGSTDPQLADLYNNMAPLIIEGLARYVADHGVSVITGGTDSGIFRLVGWGRGYHGSNAPCIGVTIAKLVRPFGEMMLAPNHSHAVLVRGQRWGDETPTLAALAATLGQRCPSVTVVIGGGALTVAELEAAVCAKRPLLVVAGSGGVADALLAAYAGQPVASPRISALAANATIVPFEASAGPDALYDTLADILDCRLQVVNFDFRF